MDKEDIHILRLMGEIERDNSPSQRGLSQRLNISLGLVNTFLKRLINKGYFKVTNLPRNRVKYLLTPKGLARKSKLTVDYLRYSVNFYRDIKKLLVSRFRLLENNQIKSILFMGAGEVAELAYLYLQLTKIRLVGIIDDRENGKEFFEFQVQSFDSLADKDWDVVLLTRLDNTEQDMEVLMKKGIDPDRIIIL